MKRDPLFGWEPPGLLFIAAKEAAKRANAMRGTLGEQSEAMTTVVLCVVVAESSINEIGEFIELHHSAPPFNIPHGLPHGFEGLDIRTRWSLLPMIVRQKSFDRGAEPWQSFEALIGLRNAIVHLWHRPLPRAARALLTAKGLVGTHEPVGFPVAMWACQTMADMFEKLTDLVGPPEEWIHDGIWSWTPRYYPHGLSTPGDPFLDQ